VIQVSHDRTRASSTLFRPEEGVCSAEEAAGLSLGGSGELVVVLGLVDAATEVY
jgi:hypothetical protein